MDKAWKHPQAFSFYRGSLGISVKTLLKYLLSLACIAYVLWGIDYNVLVASFDQISMPVLVSAQFTLILSTLPTILRLRLLSGGRINLAVACKAVYIGYALNTLLPARLGEVAKAVTLRNEGGLPMSSATGVIFMERFADLNCLLLLGALTVAMMDIPMALLPVGCLVALLWIGLLFLAFRPHWLHAVVAILPWLRIKDFCIRTLESLHQIIAPRVLFLSALYSVAAWTLGLTSLYWVLAEGVNLSLSPGQMLSTILAGTLGIAIPAAPAAIGVYESLVVGALVLAGVNKARALAVALILHLLQMLAPMVIGLLFMANITIRPRSR
jgi:uncharacterized membrane protein YbhN (UPF0104 family)